MNNYEITINEDSSEARIGVLIAKNGTTLSESPAPLKELIEDLRKDLKTNPPNEEKKSPIRKLLKFGKYKASGRGKPASEFLIQSIIEKDTFPFINNVVDINNFVSAKYCLPISIFDLSKVSFPLEIRRGREQESYIFNNAGHSIDLTDLLLISDSKGPIGNPVKDQMETKTNDLTKDFLIIIYSSKSKTNPSELESAMNEFEELLKAHADVKQIEKKILE